jgi:hypothetical protein
LPPSAHSAGSRPCCAVSVGSAANAVPPCGSSALSDLPPVRRRNYPVDIWFY